MHAPASKRSAMAAVALSKADAVALLIGASFAVGFTEVFDAGSQLLYLTTTFTPTYGSYVRLVAALAEAACSGYLFRCTFQKAPAKKGFLAAGLCQAMLLVYASAIYIPQLKALYEGHQMRLFSLVLTTFIVIVVTLVGYAIILLETAAQIPTPPPPSESAPPVDDTYAFVRHFWCGAVACAMLTLAVNTSSIFAQMSYVGPSQPFPFYSNMALGIVQAALAPVALYGALKQNTNCILTGLVLMMSLLAQVAIILVYSVFITPPGAAIDLVMVISAAINGGRLLGYGIIVAIAYKYVIMPHSTYKILPVTA